MVYCITEDCIICGTCWEICPTKSIVEYDWYYKITDTCVQCGACARVCPNAAITKKETGGVNNNPHSGWLDFALKGRKQKTRSV